MKLKKALSFYSKSTRWAIVGLAILLIISIIGLARSWGEVFGLLFIEALVLLAFVSLEPIFSNYSAIFNGNNQRSA